MTELKLIFVGDKSTEALAQGYVEEFRKFTKLETLNIQTYFGEGDGGLTNVAKLMLKDEHFPWFNTVNTLKCYEINMIDSKDVLQAFYARFHRIHTIKGIYWNDFNPFAKFQESERRVKNFIWSLPEKDEYRQAIY